MIKIVIIDLGSLFTKYKYNEFILDIVMKNFYWLFKEWLILYLKLQQTNQLFFHLNEKENPFFQLILML